jgi:hypothetical protein
MQSLATALMRAVRWLASSYHAAYYIARALVRARCLYPFARHVPPESQAYRLRNTHPSTCRPAGRGTSYMVWTIRVCKVFWPAVGRAGE